MNVHGADYGDRIVRDPDILAGKPVVRGTRIPVDVVLAYLARDPNFNHLFEDYPRLTIEDVKACLAFAGSLVADKRRVRRARSSVVRA
jgi:uncharacterized protein (DUF433 family)